MSTPNTMLRVWELVLHRSVSENQDFFFDLEGDSLKAMELIDQLGEEFDVELDAADLFENPTPAAMSTVVAGRSAAAADHVAEG